MKLVRVLGAALLLLLGPATVQGLEAGAAKVRIAVPPGVPLSGLADRMGRPATGERDSLWARCLYLDDGERFVYLVTVDLNYIPGPLRAHVVGAAAAFAPNESIILTATHTHNGPGGMDDRLPLRWISGRRNPQMIEVAGEAILTAMSEAREAKRRATLGYGTARQNVLTVNEREAEGPVDGQIGVIRVDDADGKAIAVLTNFSARPALVPRADHYRFSADYPGVYYREMEALADPGCVAMFLGGAAGDQQAVDPERNEGWERIESIGKLLAVRAKAVANGMTFHDVTLNLSYREVALPPSLSAAILPGTAPLQTLEMNGLLLAFLPGVPAADVGLELRRRALEAGYQAQFTVGPANAYLHYFVSRSNYAAPHRASERHVFGPDLEAWLYREVLALAGRETAPAGHRDVREPGREPLENGELLTFRGEGYERGYQRGAAFRTHVQTLFEERIAAGVREGGLRPEGGLWSLWPPILDPSPIALPALAVRARARLQGVDEELLGEVEGFASAADLPFDGAWLLQNTGNLGQLAGRKSLFDAPFCTMFAALGDRAGSAGVLAAHNLDWDHADDAIVARVRPETGHDYLQLGFDWQIGALTGLNDAGVALCLQRNNALGDGEPLGPPASAILHQALQYDTTYDGVLARLRAAEHIRGYQVLVVAPGEDGWRGAVVSFGRRIEVRALEDGLLLGVDPEEEDAGNVALERYRRAAGLLAEHEAIGPGEAQSVLGTGSGDSDDLGEVWNGQTRYSVILLPERQAIQVAFPGDDGRPGAYTEIRLEAGGRQ